MATQDLSFVSLGQCPVTKGEMASNWRWHLKMKLFSVSVALSRIMHGKHFLYILPRYFHQWLRMVSLHPPKRHVLKSKYLYGLKDIRRLLSWNGRVNAKTRVVFGVWNAPEGSCGECIVLITRFRGKALVKGLDVTDLDFTHGLIHEWTLIETLLGVGGNWDAWLHWRKEVTWDVILKGVLSWPLLLALWFLASLWWAAFLGDSFTQGVLAFYNLKTTEQTIPWNTQNCQPKWLLLLRCFPKVFGDSDEKVWLCHCLSVG